jgi:hypothetical protein
VLPEARRSLQTFERASELVMPGSLAVVVGVEEEEVEEGEAEEAVLAGMEVVQLVESVPCLHEKLF